MRSLLSSGDTEMNHPRSLALTVLLPGGGHAPHVIRGQCGLGAAEGWDEHRESFPAELGSGLLSCDISLLLSEPVLLGTAFSKVW